MKKKIIIVLTLTVLSIFIISLLLKDNPPKKTFSEKTEAEKEIYNYEEEKNIINEYFEIIKIDDKNYSFIYNNETFNIVYTPDNWKIMDSYKITNTEDIVVICGKLNEIHQIHGKDMVSYRTTEDMAYEWLQHNIVYQILPENHQFKINAKDVDLDPKDQGKNLIEIYEDRTGEKFDLSKLAM